jgi:mRNA interferase MazF
MPRPARGEVWLATLDPVLGNEQGGTRPVVIVSANLLNRGRAGLVVIVPMTTRERQLPWHIAIDPPEGGLRRRSFAKCEDMRSATVARLHEPWGMISPHTMELIEDRVRVLLDL